jgi:hypothetical protein
MLQKHILNGVAHLTAQVVVLAEYLFHRCKGFG